MPDTVTRKTRKSPARVFRAPFAGFAGPRPGPILAIRVGPRGSVRNGRGARPPYVINVENVKIPARSANSYFFYVDTWGGTARPRARPTSPAGPTRRHPIRPTEAAADPTPLP